jgi:sugar phosphate isomerase/epimerase
MDVKIGMNMLLWGIQITPEHIPVFGHLAAAGYDGVEIPVVGQSSAEIKTMATACDDLGADMLVGGIYQAHKYLPGVHRQNRSGTGLRTICAPVASTRSRLVWGLVWNFLIALRCF